MSEMEYGSDEHLDGLSRDALKAEVRWWHECALEMEAENAKLRELVRGLVYATHPADRAEVISDAAELMVELGVRDA